MSLLRLHQYSKVFEMTRFSNAESSDFCDTPSFPPTEHSSAVHDRAVSMDLPHLHMEQGRGSTTSSEEGREQRNP